MIPVSFVSGVCVRHDAVSASVRQRVQALRDTGRFDVRLYTHACDFSDLPHTVVGNAGQLLLDRHFRQSRVVVFHFGMFYPLFNAIAAMPPSTVRVVAFHNITPRDLVEPELRGAIERSSAQLPNMQWANSVICDSETNRMVLRRHGLAVPTSVIPPTFLPPSQMPRSKPSEKDGIVRILFIGRFVRSKGAVDLLRATRDMMRRTSQRIRLDLIGNLKFSSPEVLEQLASERAALTAQAGGRLDIDVHGSVSDEQKHALLHDADVFVLPTYHEGFCVPIVEALAHGCRVIAYENSNVPAVCGGLAHLVETGSVRALSQALEAEVEMTSHFTSSGAYRDFALGAARHIHQFRKARVTASYVSHIDSLLARSSPETRIA